MNQTAILLKLGANSTSKDKVIHVLSGQWPLTGKEIYGVLVKQHSLQNSEALKKYGFGEK